MSYSYFTLGYKCNHNCIICPNGFIQKNQEALSIESLKSSVDELIENGNTMGITLSGGEPSLQDSFLDIIAYISSKGIPISILSNGDRFSNKELVYAMCKSIKNKKRCTITTAFHSSKPELHDEISGSKGSFYRTIEGCKNILDSGIALNIKHCIHRMNYEGLSDFIDFVYDSFPEEVPLILNGVDYLGLDEAALSRVSLTFKETGLYIEKALDNVIEYRQKGIMRQVVVAELPLCSVDPYYWGFFISSCREAAESYIAPNHNNNQLEFCVESDCGTSYATCSLCDVRELCPGAWRRTVEVLGVNSLEPIEAIIREE